MKVLLSIKPEFAEKIFDGTKKYEFRKTIFKRPISQVVVYASSPVMQVIGEFQIADILQDDIETIWKETTPYSGVSKDFYNRYFANKDKAYAIKVGKKRRYKKSKRLSDFNIQYAPQSFAYIQ